jgi:DNA-binding transcriptional ArsR family regulator
MANYKNKMRDLIGVTKALADENRVRILAALTNGELCVCQVVELIQLAPSTVSKHLLVLKQARLIDSRKAGRWIHYRLADIDVPPVVSGAIEWIRESLSGDEKAAQDGRRLKGILKIEPVALCCAQREERSGTTGCEDC